MSPNLNIVIRRIFKHFQLKNEIAARRVVNHLVQTEKDSIILPCKEDYLKNELITRNFKKLIICGYGGERVQQAKCRIGPENVHNHDFDLLHIIKNMPYNQNQSHEDLVKQIIGNHFDSGCDIPIKIVIPLLRMKDEKFFMHNLYYQASLRVGFCSLPTIQYYMLLSDRQWMQLIAQPGHQYQYRSSSIFMNTVFNVTSLESLDLESSFEIKLRNLQTTARAKEMSYPNVHLVCLEPRASNIGLVQPRFLLHYKYLVTQMMYKRTNRVHKSLQNFFQRFDKDLTRMGISSDMRVSDLDPDLFFKLFVYLTRRPDYPNSNLANIADREIIDFEKG